MSLLDVNEFFTPPDDLSLTKATFWICPKFSGQVIAGIDGMAAAAGHAHTNDIVISILV